MKKKRFVLALAALLIAALGFGALAASKTKKPVESIQLEGPETVYAGTSKKLTVTVLPEDAGDKRLRWSVSDKAIASVKSNGTVRGKKSGKVTVTAEARDGSGVTASIEINVIAKVDSIKLETSSVTLPWSPSGGGTAKAGFTVSPKDAYYRGVTWSSSDESVVTVDAEGTLRAQGPGTARITCATQDPESRAKATLKVTVERAVESITVTDPPSVINKGASVRVKAEALPKSAADRGILYKSSDESVFTVDKSGTVRAKGTGTATLTLTARDGSGVTEEIELTVIQMVTGIRAKSAPSALIKGQSKRVTLTVSPADATDPVILWSSSDPEVASVDETGRVTALKAGECTLYAKARDGSGKQLKLPLTVEPSVPVKLSGAGRGVESAGIIVMRFKNLCKKLKISRVSFEFRALDASGNVLAGGGGEAEISVAPGEKATAVLTSPAPEDTEQYAYILKGVTFSDGTAYTIPEAERTTTIWSE